MTRHRTSVIVAYALFALAVAECVSWTIGLLVTGLSYAAARDSFMISNATIGVGCAVCGLLIAGKRPFSRLGWLLLGAGVAQNGTAAVTPWLVNALATDAPDGRVRALATVYSFAWPWSVSVLIPMALLHFPDGRLPARRWRYLVGLIVVNGITQMLLFSAYPNPLDQVTELGPATHDRGKSFLRIPALPIDGTFDLLSSLVLTASFAACLVSLILRYRRGDDRTRLQLLWLMLAAAVTTVVILGERLLQVGESFPIILTATIALVPAAMAIAVLRYQLLDIRWVWSRTVTYALLTCVVVAAYVTIVDLASRLIELAGIGGSLLATVLIALGFNPARIWLQHRVDRLLYGERSDPVRAASSVTDQLAILSEHPADILPAVCEALRLPYASLADPSGVIAEHGQPPSQLESISLRLGGRPFGELRIGVRPGQRRLDPVDRKVLELMAVPIGVALQASALSRSLQASRQELVAAREEERRIIRRDLHDGLGPLLTGLAFQADTVIAVADSDPVQVRALGEQIRAGVTAAINDVRELVNQLHPSMLDDLGLVEAVRRHALRLNRHGDGGQVQVCLQVDPELPPLSAAVEMAAYRIVTEALTNVARHSDATRVEIEISAAGSDALRISIADDGRTVTAWNPGIGLRSMGERAAELGGRLEAGPTPDGGRVTAHLPARVQR